MVAYPGHDTAVVEPQPQLRVHRHAAVDAFHDPHDVGGVSARWHEVDHPNGPGMIAPFGLQHQGVLDVAAGGANVGAGRRDPPVPGIGGVEQRGEAGGGIELRQAQPINGAGGTDQRSGLQVPEQGVVLDTTHALILPGATTGGRL